NHVNDIKKEGILHLVVIPLILVIGTFLAPQILQLIFGSVIGGSTDIASLAGMIGMLITILIAPLIMAKVGGYKLETLGITKEKLVENMLKGGLGGLQHLA
ncbi:TPA: hypothetical protein U1367_001887, partial [Streptococcus suis]|nr:hypothetical protein [Streptococcus suis]